MSLSAERISIANRAIRQTVEQSSIGWQSVPHWNTGDPGQTMVRSDTVCAIAGAGAVPQPAPDPLGGAPIPIDSVSVPFRMTLAQAMSPTPDALLAAVGARAADLAQQLDTAVLAALRQPVSHAVAVGGAAGVAPWYWPLSATAAGPGAVPTPPEDILAALVNGRQTVEDSGFRAPSCLIASTRHFLDLNRWIGSNVATEGLLVGANANSIHRASQLNRVGIGGADMGLMLMIGRRQQIEHGCAGSASPGEEPVDIAISVPPSLEVIGENAAGQLELAVRMRFATRVKDQRGVVVLHT